VYISVQKESGTPTCVKVADAEREKLKTVRADPPCGAVNEK
jgi:hypothetical protein